VNNDLNVSAHTGRNSIGVISGERGGHGIGPSRPTQPPGKFMSRNFRTIRVQWEGAPSCWNTTFDWWSSYWGNRYNCNISRQVIGIRFENYMPWKRR
jgi:hypothetical protein